jgi:crotonobetaine/carnitine-CoA ligase
VPVHNAGRSAGERRRREAGEHVMSLIGESQIVYVGDRREPATLPTILELRAETTPDATFVTFEGQPVTYAEMLMGARRAAAALATLDVGRGDRVALMLTNCLEFLDLWFGSALLGAVLVPVNTGLKGEGLRYLVEHSDVKVVIADPSVLEAFDAAVPASVASGGRFTRGAAVDRWGSLQELLGGGHADPARVRLAPGELASVLYTSGTTGPPKGVMNCHNAYVTAAYEFTQRYVRLRQDDVMYTSLPLFHVNAQMLTTIGSIVSGRPMVLAPRFSASGFLDDLRRHDATIFNYIGAMLTMIAKQPQRADDGHNPARLAVGGAAPAELWPDFEHRYGVDILEIYGLTETATFCLGSPPDDIRVGQLGRPVSWSDVKVARPDGTEADRGEPGEILIRSTRPDVLFHGYYKNDAATAAAMEGGWFHSGDRGVQDDDGYFTFIDRIKDAIRRRGENISSYEVERVVNSHPGVAESAAVGVPSELGEDDVMIVVVPRPGAGPVGAADLTAYCAERMAAFMVPRYVRFRASLPKTATERVQKFALRDEGVQDAWERPAADPPEP